MKYLITGGCGFVGSNLAARLLGEYADVTIFDNLSRNGSGDNLSWLRSQGALAFVHGDIRNAHEVDFLISSVRPDVVFHLAGQVAMTTSMADPRRDFEINAVGSINLLEAVRRHRPDCVIVYASSNKVYGALPQVTLREEGARYTSPSHPAGIGEDASLDFQTPYGCSKGAADQYMLDYARCHGIRTVVFRHSTIYGGRQFATFDQGWVGWFCQQALAVKKDPDRAPFTISGDGKQVRDLLFVDDAVECYLRAAACANQVKGEAFNIGGGMENSSSLLELFEMLESTLSLKMTYRRLPWRHSDQRFFVADNSKAKRLLDWCPTVSKSKGVESTLEWARGQSN
jgi:CDP-paratose 2-epimerase